MKHTNPIPGWIGIVLLCLPIYLLAQPGSQPPAKQPAPANTALFHIIRSGDLAAPLEGGEIHLAALCVRAIRLYAPPAQSKRVEQLVTRTRTWLENTVADVQQEQNFQLLGLEWCGSGRPQKEKVAARLLALQHPDGSWSQLPTMAGDAYATGQALYALSETGMTQPGDPVFQKGVTWLLKHQDASGAWIMETRAFAIQPFFNSDFPPYDENQYISATATNWAALALLNALPDQAVAVSK
jgi:hypothetical protein